MRSYLTNPVITEYNSTEWVDDRLRNEEIKGERLRAMHPGLQELWDQYQTMLKLVDDESDQ